jgi:uncharacterized membrane protein
MEIIERIINAVINIHPLHPMVVHFPVALTGAAFLFVLLAWGFKSSWLEATAFANIALAAVATVVAGATGIFDNLRNYAGDAPNASAKIWLAALLLFLTTALALVRWRNPEIFTAGGWRKALYIIGYGLAFLVALTLAFLGGIILYGW